MEVVKLTVYYCSIAKYPDIYYAIAAKNEDEAFKKLQSLCPEDRFKREDIIIENVGSIFY